MLLTRERGDRFELRVEYAEVFEKGATVEHPPNGGNTHLLGPLL